MKIEEAMVVQEKNEFVNHPKHYNNHESGVEAIEVIRSFDFNLGNSFKYIYRRNEKDNTFQDIQKAVWYIDDEIKRRKTKNSFIVYVANDIPNFIKFFEHKKRIKLVNKIISFENNLLISKVYEYLNYCDYYPYEIEKLQLCLKYLI
jgi:hypothetical protein